MPTAAVLAVSSIGGALASNSASKKAVKASASAADKASLQTLQSKNRARQDLELLFPQAQQSANQGFQSALDVFGQSVPAQSNAFQQGNIGAQQAILSGLPQIQNALFGNQVDFSQMQPFQVQQPDTSFLNQQTPVTIQNQINAEQAAAAEQQRLSNEAASQGPSVGIGPNIGNLSGNILGGGSSSLGNNMLDIFRNQER